MAVSSSAKSKTIAYDGVNELLEELAAQVPETLRDDDVTPSRLVEKLKRLGKPVSRSWAQRWLDQLVESGKLVKVHVMVSKGGNGFAYRKP